MATQGLSDTTAEVYRDTRVAHWDAIARGMRGGRRSGGYYHRRLNEVYRFHIPVGRRVLEVGSGDGDLLAALQPSVGVGIDFSPDMVDLARTRHPELRFIHGDAHDLDLDETFDFVVLSDLVNDVWDVQRILQQVARVSAPRTRVIVNTFSNVWALPLKLAAKMHLSQPSLRQNWLTVEDLGNLFRLSGFELMRSWQEILWPVRTPLLDAFCNRYLVKLFPINWLGLTNFVIARPMPQDAAAGEESSVSVIIPARNEAGNIERLLARVPELGSGTEIVFVEGHSTDDTYAAILRAVEAHPHRRCTVLQQTGKGKGDAVRLGFAKATGDIVMILDADISVAPEDLARFYEALRDGKGEFLNGVRLVYPMEDRAMRFWNLVGNKFFTLAFSWLIGTAVKDTLCGTKALWKKDYELLSANRAYFGDFDPFGDFDLLFGAAKLNLKIVDLPIRYRERTYGTTNIQRWRHGWILLNMVLFAANRIKFV
jgi:ubiquinone/menaquinone biosynthesis C-methylase UbiE